MYENGNLIELKLKDILPNRFQPRFYFDKEKLAELSESIRRYGVISPIVVRPINGKYEIIAGERRYKASVLAGKEKIPAIVININDKDAAEIALLENVQRQSLSPIEEAVSYKRILDSGYITGEELSQKIGKSQSNIARKINLLSLDDRVQDALLKGKISERHARALCRIANKDDQVKMLERIINERLTVKMTDRAIKDYLNSKNEEKKPISQDKKIIFNDTPKEVESLFTDNEIKEKENNMDIDKMMNEAKDINADDTPNDIADLMKQEPGGPSYTNTPAPSTPVNTYGNAEEQGNKFVNNQPMRTPTELNPEQTNTGVSFDSIFNQKPIETPTMKETPSQEIEEPTVPEEIHTQAESSFAPSYHTIGTTQTTEDPEVNDGDDVTISSSDNSEEIPSLDVNVDEDEPTPEPTEAPRPNNFKEVITLIRDCASKIEALGYYVNVDEMDLEDDYQVTFKIDKNL